VIEEYWAIGDVWLYLTYVVSRTLPVGREEVPHGRLERCIGRNVRCPVKSPSLAPVLVSSCYQVVFPSSVFYARWNLIFGSVRTSPDFTLGNLHLLSFLMGFST